MVESKHKWKAWLYLSPAIILLLIFTVWPIINTVRMAFLENYNSMAVVGGKVYNFGIGNFKQVLEYNAFLDCLGNTMLLTVLTVPLSTFLALLIAVCLNAIKPLQRFLQTVFFLPYVTNSIAIGMVFAAMFNMVGSAFGGENEIVVTAGIINNVIEFFGGSAVNWINAGSTYAANITVMVVYIVWNALPFKILILLGGLQSINKQYYDAARVDGTSRRRVFTKITVPLLSPMLAYVVITGFIGGFKEYSSIVGIFGEHMGPAGDADRLNTMETVESFTWADDFFAANETAIYPSLMDTDLIVDLFCKEKISMCLTHSYFIFSQSEKIAYEVENQGLLPFPLKDGDTSQDWMGQFERMEYALHIPEFRRTSEKYSDFL